jgi:4-oxalocrotonate tautomerase
MTSTLGVAIGDRFQIISEHESTRLVIDPYYLGIERPAEAGIIQVRPSEGRTADRKKAF